MFYRKNVGITERWVRGLAGAAIAIAGLIVSGASTAGLLAAFAGLITAATGIFGFCPACALVGWRSNTSLGRRTHGES